MSIRDADESQPQINPKDLPQNPAANISLEFIKVESQDYLLDDGLLNSMPDIDDILKYDVKDFQQDKDGKMTMEFGVELEVPGF